MICRISLNGMSTKQWDKTIFVHCLVSFSVFTQVHQLMCVCLHFGCIYLYLWHGFGRLFDLITFSSPACLFVFTRIVSHRRNETVEQVYTHTARVSHFSDSNRFKDMMLNDWKNTLDHIPSQSMRCFKLFIFSIMRVLFRELKLNFLGDAHVE